MIHIKLGYSFYSLLICLLLFLTVIDPSLFCVLRYHMWYMNVTNTILFLTENNIREIVTIKMCSGYPNVFFAFTFAFVFVHGRHIVIVLAR